MMNTQAWSQVITAPRSAKAGTYSYRLRLTGTGGDNRDVTERTTWSRADHLARLEEPFDLVVVGGGIVGAGIALDAAHRGKRVAVVDRDDWAAGTSSRSTKLLHGGVRYLPQLRFRLIRDGLKEQEVLRRNADYLVEPIDFIIPVYRDRGFADAPAWARHPRIFPIAIRLGLWFYDRLGGRPWRTKRKISKTDLRRRFPKLRTAGLRHGVRYEDAQTDDARLALMVIKTAVARGAIAVNHAAATAIDRDGAGWTVTIRDRLGGSEHVLRTATVAAATGTDHPPGDDSDDLPIVFSKGAHLNVATADVGVADAALVLPETSDSRVLFLVPWHGHVIVGTTDTPYDGDTRHPVTDDADVAYLTSEVLTYLDVDELDAISAWAGLRALVGAPGGSTARASREHRVIETAPGYVRVAGGKLTGYRSIAEDVVDRLYGRRSRSRHGTEDVMLHGSGIASDLIDGVATELASLGAPESLAPDLVRRYGTTVREVLDLAHRDPALAARIAEGWLAAEVVHAVRSESAATITDFIQRRTRIAWFTQHHGRESLDQIARLMATESGWDKRRIRAEVRRTEADLAAEGL
jgi:glycerol-3-phosphate dehydrogenase